jgi:RNA polymerase sigma-70 factor (family 1)
MNTLQEHDEKILLERISNGDEAAFKIIYDTYRHKIVYIAWKFLRSEARAEDVLQEIFLKVWIQRKNLAHIEHFSSWINTLTRHHLYNALRKLSNDQAFLAVLGSHPVLREHNNVLEAMTSRELESALQSAVARLTPQERKMYELSRVEGMTHDQIARHMDVSKETVKKHLTNALQKIRTHIRVTQQVAQLGLLIASVIL